MDEDYDDVEVTTGIPHPDGDIVAQDGGGSTGEIYVLPMPAKLDQKRTSRSLMSAVKGYFYPAYNSNSSFRRHLASVGNADSVTKNRMFDRHVCTMIIREMAQKANDRMTAEAPAGMIYQCLVTIMRSEDLGLKVRRIKYHQLTHQRAAAD